MDSVHKPSLAIAYRHVLEYLGQYGNENELISLIPDELNWSAIPGLDDVETGQYGTYPYHSPAIVLFDNGTFHFVDSPADRTILDSGDHESKRFDVYGTPVAWATFELSELPVNPVTGEPNKDRTYTVEREETIWDVARKLKISADILIEHNDLAKPHDPLKAGDVLHLPEKVKKEREPEVRIELLENPVVMHTNKDTKKYSFGNHKKWKNISQSGRTIAENTTLTDIVAKAHVPVEDVVAVYWLDKWALGEYPGSGRLGHTIGYAFNDLTEGKYVEEKEIRKPVKLPSPTPAEIAETAEAVHEPTILDEPEEPNEELFDQINEDVHPDAWYQTYQTFRDEKDQEITKGFYLTLPEPEKSYIVHDLSGARPGKQKFNGDYIECKGRFIKDGNEYFRPVTFHWYGIPPEILTDEDEVLHNMLEDSRMLSKDERTLTMIARGSAKARYSFQELIGKNFKVKKEK